MSELININLIIADRPYPLKVKPEEEATVRAAAKQINEKVKELQNLYAAKDKQDFLAMSALTYAVETANLKQQSLVSDQSAQEKVDALLQLLQHV